MIMLIAGCLKPVDRDLPFPAQTMEAPGAKPVDSAKRIKPLARFESETLVLSRHRYDRDIADDPISEFAPVDLVMAWGTAGRAWVRDGVTIRQGSRRYTWWAGPEAWERAETRRFGHLSANWHMVPANDEVAKKLASIGAGDIVRVDGELVEIDLADGRTARSSLTRDDEGDGACEIVWIRSIDVVAQ